MPRYKVSFYCDEKQVAKLTGAVFETVHGQGVQGLTVVKVEEKKQTVWSEGVNVRKCSGGEPYTEGPNLTKASAEAEAEHKEYLEHAQFVRPRATRVAGGRPTSQTESGRIFLRLFDNQTLCRPVDFCKALKDAGYSTNSWGAIAAGLIREGMLYRSGRGAYRRPTPLEEVQSK